MVELEFLQATIARTAEQLASLQSQTAAAESRIESSKEDLAQVLESYVEPVDQEPLVPIPENNLTLTTFFFKNFINPPGSVAPDYPETLLHPPYKMASYSSHQPSSHSSHESSHQPSSHSSHASSHKSSPHSTPPSSVFSHGDRSKPRSSSSTLTAPFSQEAGAGTKSTGGQAPGSFK